MDNLNDKKITLRFVGWFFLINGIIFWLVGYKYLQNILFSPSLFENSLVGFSSFPEKTFVVFFAIINYLSYMIVLAFIPALIVWLCAFFLPYKRLILSFSVLFATISLILLLINNRIYAMFKFHLNGTIIAMFFNGDWYDVFDFSAQETKTFILLAGMILLLEVCLAVWVWKRIILTGRYQVGKTVSKFLAGGFFMSYLIFLQSLLQDNNLLIQQTPNLPLYNQFMVYLIPIKNANNILYRFSETHFTQPLFSQDKLHYPLVPVQCSPKDKPLNIILIMVDSLRFDSIQSQYMPVVTKFAKENWQFQTHLSGGNSTQPGLFSLFYSLPGNYWTAALEQKTPPVFMDLLRQYGYVAKIIWSSQMVNPPFDKTIYSGITSVEREGSLGDDIGNRDRQISQEAIRFLETRREEGPFFLNLFYDAAHGYCREQSYPIPFQPAIKSCTRFGLSNDVDPLPFYNRYINAVHFIDAEIGKVMATIEKKGYLDNSIILITSDHGQEFNDNKQNYWEHTSNYTKAQVQIPLIIHWPGQKAKTIDYLTSSYDVVPTLLQGLFHCQNNITDYSIGQNLLVEEGRLPFILSGSYSNMGLIEPDRLTTLRASGEISITNLKAEPQPKAKPRRESIRIAMELMRKYYVK